MNIEECNELVESLIGLREQIGREKNAMANELKKHTPPDPEFYKLSYALPGLRSLASTFDLLITDAKRYAKIMKHITAREPEPEYRELSIGETVERGDEVLLCGAWKTTQSFKFEVRPQDVGKYRRLKLVERAKAHVQDLREIREAEAMSECVSIAPGSGYRLLGQGEFVKEGDDFYSPTTGWVAVTQSIRERVPYSYVGRYRRKIEEQAVEPGYRLLKAGEKVVRGDEFLSSGARRGWVPAMAGIFVAPGTVGRFRRKLDNDSIIRFEHNLVPVTVTQHVSEFIAQYSTMGISYVMLNDDLHLLLEMVKEDIEKKLGLPPEHAVIADEEAPEGYRFLLAGEVLLGTDEIRNRDLEEEWWSPVGKVGAGRTIPFTAKGGTYRRPLAKKGEPVKDKTHGDEVGLATFEFKGHHHARRIEYRSHRITMESYDGKNIEATFVLVDGHQIRLYSNDRERLVRTIKTVIDLHMDSVTT